VGQRDAAIRPGRSIAAMQIIFFAARRIQRDYFQQLCEHIDCTAQVIWYKSIWLPGITGLLRLPLSELNTIVAAKITEKRNASRADKPVFFWNLYGFTRLLGAIWLFLIYDRYFRNHPCATIGLWNGNKFRQSVVVAVAHTLQRHLVFFENGLLPNTTTVDFRGVNACNSVPRDPDFYRQLRADVHTPLPQQLVARKTETAKGGEKLHALPERFIFVPFQVNTDSQITLHSPWIKNMWQLFEAIAAARQALGDTAPHFVFKEHPSCPQDYRELHERCKNDDHLLFANDFSTQELIQRAEAIVTINSTVGLESLLLGKKVVVLGNAFYDIDGLTLPAHSQTQLLDALRALDHWHADEKLRDNFLHYLHDDYAILDNWATPTATHWQSMNTRLGCARSEKQAALFLVSTPLNLFIASGIALQQADAIDAHLVFIDQGSISDNPYITAAQDWPQSPFTSVSVLPAKARQLGDKLKTRRDTFLQLETLIHRLTPARIYTGSDRRIEFQFAMHTAADLNRKTIGAYMDDGTFTYVGRKDRGWRDNVIDNLLKKLIYGPWWRQPETVGGSTWISEAYVAFPELAHPLIRRKALHTLDAECFRSPAIQALSEKLLAQFALDRDDLQRLDILFTLPHDSLIKHQGNYNRMLTDTIEALHNKGLNVGVKYHPRHDPINDLNLKALDNMHVLPQQLGFEAILPLLGNAAIIGDVSTTLLSSKWLRPDLKTISLMLIPTGQSDEFLELFARLKIPVINSIDLLWPLLGTTEAVQHS
jgi:capsular polysaccharide export protein